MQEQDASEVLAGDPPVSLERAKLRCAFRS
jgi:hypothetical protein